MNNNKWKSGLCAVMLGSMFVTGSSFTYAAESNAATVAASSAPSVNYGLTSDIRAAIKSVAVTPTATGSQISATIRLYNGGSVENRIPEHELHVRMASGVEYTLSASASNKGALQPKEISEFVYMASVDSKDIGAIAQIAFVNVDVYSFPKVETTLLTMPTASVWYGVSASAPMKPTSVAWGQSFAIPGINSDLVYTPKEASVQDTSSGRAVVVTVLVENPGTGHEAVPSFRLDGQSGQQTYTGKRLGDASVALEAGEQKYMHFAIPVDSGVTLTNLLVVDTDTYSPTSGGSPVTVATGKLSVEWPQDSGPTKSAAQSYALGQPIAFDSLTKVVDKKTEVSLIEFHVADNPDEGYKTAIAKFRLTNMSDASVATPNFQTEITDAQHTTYQGTRQANVTTTLNPGLSYVVSYSFSLPESESGSDYKLKLLDAQAVAPYTTAIATLQTVVQKDDGDGKTFSLYPFSLKINDVSVSTQYSNNTYTYKFRLDLDIAETESVVVDSNFSKLRLEIVDNSGRQIGYKDVAFTGSNKLISGVQKIDASNIATDQFNYPYTTNIYEIVDTQNGTAKRLLKTVK